MSSRLHVIPAVALAAAAVSLLATGCGGGLSSPRIASIAGSTTPATTSTPSGSGGGGAPQSDEGPPTGAHFRIVMNVGTADGDKYSACMRKHGVSNFPDPNGQGVISIDSGTGIDPSSPTFQSARSACQKLLPNGGRPTPAQLAKLQRQLLALSKCMRAHGIKDFPDPSSGGLRLRLAPGSDLDPNSPTFRNAQQACRKYMPFNGAPKGG